MALLIYLNLLEMKSTGEEFDQELKALIEKNLPKQTGEVLSKVLEQGKRDAEELNDYKALSLKQQGEIERLKGELDKHEALDVRELQVADKEKVIDARQTKQLVEELNYQLTAEKDKTDFVKSVALGLVRNTEYRKNIFDYENKGGLPVFDGQGNAHYPIETSKNYNETGGAE